jgi:hypothetical protein
MEEPSERTPETSTPVSGSTRDETLGRVMFWTAVGVGAVALLNGIGKAALSKQRDAHLDRIAPRPSGRSLATGSAAPASPPGQGLYGSKPWAVHEKRADLERYWKMDDRR